jgi:phosphatidate cytidylyltransferase
MDVQRLISAFIMVITILSAIIFLPSSFLLAFVAFIVGVSNWEFFRLRFSFLVSILASITLALLMIFTASSGSFYYLLLLSVSLWILLGLFTISFPHSKEFMQNSVLTWLSGLIIHLSFWYSISFIITQSATDLQIYNIEGRYLLVLIISLSALMDTLAYFGGRKFGKRKFLKNISPNKTLEGFIIAIGTVPIVFTILFSFITNLPTLSLFIIFLITSLFSVLGDAAASLFKRVAGVKDSSNLIPGHGGVFDRIDSHLAAIPLFIIVSLTIF